MAQPLRVLVLGAGFGGLEVTATLSEQLGDAVEVTLVDRTEGFVFGFSKLDVMFGRATADEVLHSYADIARPGVRVLRADVRHIDAVARVVTTDAGRLEADVLVVALGADLEPSATPGLVEDGHEFYTEQGAFDLRGVLERFTGGDVVVGVASTPFKCPPAPSETVLLLHDLLTERGLRESSSLTLVIPLPTPVPPSPAASQSLLTEFAARDIRFVGNAGVQGLDPERHVALLSDGGELPYDLFLGVPVHRAPQVVLDSGLAVDGWIPVDPLTLQTAYPDVYAVGDVASVGTPKAGVFAEGQAQVVAAAIIARARGEQSDLTYDGNGICYLEFGHSQVAKVDVTFRSGESPTGFMEGPSQDIADDKVEFGSSRLRRWFGTTA